MLLHAREVIRKVLRLHLQCKRAMYVQLSCTWRVIVVLHLDVVRKGCSFWEQLLQAVNAALMLHQAHWSILSVKHCVQHARGGCYCLGAHSHCNPPSQPPEQQWQAGDTKHTMLKFWSVCAVQAATLSQPHKHVQHFIPAKQHPN
jgi:hypothetical protein